MANRTILVVDDEPELRSLARRALEKAGYEVEEFGAGAKALDRMRTEPRPDLVLLDVVMPGMDGWAFLAELSHDPEAGKVPVILCSSMVDLEHSKLPAGVDVAGRLEKPFTSPVLVETVKQVLARAVAARF